MGDDKSTADRNSVDQSQSTEILDARTALNRLLEYQRAGVKVSITTVPPDLTYLERLYEKTGNVQFVWKALSELREDQPVPLYIRDFMSMLGINFVRLAERADTQRLSKQEVLNQALAILDLQVFKYNAIEEFNRIVREDAVLREHGLMTAGGEKVEVAAMLLAQKHGVDRRTIFRWLKAASERAERLR